jgi:hypothetical protein
MTLGQRFESARRLSSFLLLHQNLLIPFLLLVINAGETLLSVVMFSAPYSLIAKVVSLPTWRAWPGL